LLSYRTREDDLLWLPSLKQEEFNLWARLSAVFCNTQSDNRTGSFTKKESEMKPIERWKVRRELWRLHDKVTRWASATFYDPVRQFVYDCFFQHLLKLHTGELELTQRVAILVIFQPKGLSQSTLLTLDHLHESGWSVLVVSNHTLTVPDRFKVLSRCAQLIERPNVGYDFGAYRDGVRHLWQGNTKPENLVLLNDSTWFPIRLNDTSLKRMEALDVDLSGHIYKIEDSEKRERDHLESHLLMFGKRFLEHSAFLQFWNSYVMSDNRENTIKRGEKQITQTALSLGLSVQGLLFPDSMIEILGGLSDIELSNIVRQMVHHRNDAKVYCDRLLANSEAGQPWREDYLTWVSDVLFNSRQHLFSVTFIETAIHLSGMGFIKKANDNRHQLARIAVLHAEDEKRIEALNEVIRQEIETAVKSGVVAEP